MFCNQLKPIHGRPAAGEGSLPRTHSHPLHGVCPEKHPAPPRQSWVGSKAALPLVTPASLNLLQLVLKPRSLWKTPKALLLLHRSLQDPTAAPCRIHCPYWGLAAAFHMPPNTPLILAAPCNSCLLFVATSSSPLHWPAGKLLPAPFFPSQKAGI